MELIASAIYKRGSSRALQLKIESNNSAYSFLYAVNPGEWNLLKGDVDAKFLSTKEAGGFVGCMIALYATSLGIPSSARAYFDWFNYVGDDAVYKTE